MKQVLKKIMCVEDDADIQTIIKFTLELDGFEVLLCQSGSEALAAAPSFLPELILLDVMLPNMNGLTVFKKLRELPATHDIPIIFMTARIQSNERKQYEELGAIGLIVKPFDSHALPELIRSMWRGAYEQ